MKEMVCLITSIDFLSTHPFLRPLFSGQQELSKLDYYFQNGGNTGAQTNQPVRVFTGSDLITGSARNWLFSSFLKHFIIIIMFVKYVYDHNNDVWIIKVGDDSYYLTGSGPKMVK